MEELQLDLFSYLKQLNKTDKIYEMIVLNTMKGSDPLKMGNRLEVTSIRVRVPQNMAP